MRFILTITLMCLEFHCFSQLKFYSCGDNGEIIESNSFDCTTRSIGNYTIFGDIAITPNGDFFGITDKLYKIDTIAQNSTVISSQLITGIGGLGLIAIDNERLLFDKQDSLFVYNLSLNTENFLGTIGYQCNGDFSFLDDYLYMISDVNDLIKISIDWTNEIIISVENIGYLNSFSATAYSLFTAYESCSSSTKSLFIIDELTVYKVDEINAQLVQSCTLNSDQISYGSASLLKTANNPSIIEVPNVFTPNNDQINDVFSIETSNNVKSFEILNRWGNIVYCWKQGTIDWDGKTQIGLDVSEGVYFYIMTMEKCKEIIKKGGYITLLR